MTDTAAKPLTYDELLALVSDLHRDRKRLVQAIKVMRGNGVIDLNRIERLANGKD